MGKGNGAAPPRVLYARRSLTPREHIAMLLALSNNEIVALVCLIASNAIAAVTLTSKQLNRWYYGLDKNCLA
jgi:hypothetical protein